MVLILDTTQDTLNLCEGSDLVLDSATAQD